MHLTQSSPTINNEFKITHSGFTAIELLVVIGIVAILAGLAAPSFTEVFRRFRVDSASEEFSASVILARSEAVRRGAQIVIRRSTNCGIALTGIQDWSCGWLIFPDEDRNNVLSGTEALTQQVSAPRNVTIRKSNVINPDFIVIDRFGQINQLGQRFEFFPTGMTTTDGKIVCFTTGTRLRTLRNSATCN